MKITGTQILAAGAVVVGGYVVIRVIEGAAGVPGALGRALNPTSPDNIFHRGVNAFGDVVDNAERDRSFSLGSWVYDLFHPEYDPNEAIRGPLQ